MERTPIVAGQFYPGEPDLLRAELNKITDKDAQKEDVLGMVVPHAGYMFSGPVAGATFSRTRFKNTFVILGPNHTGRGAPFSIMSEGTWKTPLGEVDIDTDLGAQILQGSDYLEEDTTAHLFEHSIEVEVPFLQFFKPDIKIVPIVVAATGGDVYKEIGRSIAKAVKELQKDIVIVASSDMSHYEPQESADRKDHQAIESILRLDEDELLERVENLGITMCGYGPAVSMISAARELGAREGELVQYGTSGDVLGDYSSVVGYAGILIKRG
ncbi:MAG: AmmeMemoRadiSam system protein B [Chloroflexota bacterium]